MTKLSEMPSDAGSVVTDAPEDVAAEHDGSCAAPWTCSVEGWADVCVCVCVWGRGAGGTDTEDNVRCCLIWTSRHE